MKLSSQKRIAREILKAGSSRVRLRNEKEVEEALTRQDIRNLARRGLVWKVQKKGTSKFASKKIKFQKKKGRRKGFGSRKGTSGARKDSKVKWTEVVRAQRSLLRNLRDSERLNTRDYRKLYSMVKGGFFRSRSHLLFHLKEQELIKASPKTRKARAKPSKTTKKGKSRKAKK